MPELPEVETIKNDLAPIVAGHHFVGVTFLCPQMVRHLSPDELCQRLIGQTIREVARRGKYLIFRLNDGEALLLHLRMSGSLLIKSSPVELNSYTRAIFNLENGIELHFCDRRKLGTIELVRDEAEAMAKLGPEPLDPSFTTEVLSQRLSRHRAPIKAVLCDQAFLAGIGNMYADEALFSARIHPLKPARALSEEEIARLHRAIRQVLLSAIDNRGATISDYTGAYGQPGRHQYEFYVAHRGGQACRVCQTAIQRIPIRNRGTYFCPNCQKK